MKGNLYIYYCIHYIPIVNKKETLTISLYIFAFFVAASSSAVLQYRQTKTNNT